MSNIHVFRRFLKSKIHGIKITESNLDYNGSITLDPDLMAIARITEFEEVQVLNKNNGTRLTTYVIAGEPGQKQCCLNGPAARLGHPGDVLIILSYVSTNLESYSPFIVSSSLLQELGYN